MLPRWFRAVLAAEIAGLVAVAVLGIHVAGQGLRSAGSALTWLRPERPPAATPRPRAAIIPLTGAGTAPSRLAVTYGAALLTPSLLRRLNQDTGATAVGEYALLLDLEALARDEVTHLLRGIAVAPQAAATGR